MAELLSAPTLGNQQSKFGGLAAGAQRKLSPIIFFPGPTFLSAAGALSNLARLLQPPPVSQLQSRIRSAAARLPGEPLTTATAIAMVDLIHDRLQRLTPHTSSWPGIRDTVLHLLQSGDFDAFGDYYNQPSSSHATEWKDLHPGHLVLSPSVVQSVLSQAEHPRSPKSFACRTTFPSPAMDSCIDNLSSEHIISFSNCPLPPTMSLFLKPKDAHSARVICDLRPLNNRYKCLPPSFALPTVSELVCTTRFWEACFFTKLDISAYFHSLELQPHHLQALSPPNVRQPFIFTYYGKTWSWERLPFGWSWAPALAQAQMRELADQALASYPDIMTLVYYDDILLASPSPSRLVQATSALVAYLKLRGLRLADHKCVLTPVTTVDWIGKHISHGVVANTESRVRQLAGVLHGLSLCRSARLLRKIIGWTSWYSSHFPGSHRALSEPYRALHGVLTDGLSWSVLWAFSLSIALGSCSVRWCSDSTSGLCIFYSDASADNKQIGICDFRGTRGVSLSIPFHLLCMYPRLCDAQQTAELYGVCVAVAAAALQRHSALVFTDNQACAGWFTGARLPATGLQSQLLLAASVLQTLNSVDCTVRWSPGKHNPADPWSRVQLHPARNGVLS